MPNQNRTRYIDLYVWYVSSIAWFCPNASGVPSITRLVSFGQTLFFAFLVECLLVTLYAWLHRGRFLPFMTGWSHIIPMRTKTELRNLLNTLRNFCKNCCLIFSPLLIRGSVNPGAVRKIERTTFGYSVADISSHLFTSSRRADCEHNKWKGRPSSCHGAWSGQT